MNNCCTNESQVQLRPEACPTCAQKGKPVDTQTVKALLAVSLEQIDESSAYRFCRTPTCPIVYYGANSFSEADLREKVHQKHPDDDEVLVCYCYYHSPGSIRLELEQHGDTDVVERVTAQTVAGTCACDIRNPQGSCCLGNLRAVVKQLTAKQKSHAL